MLAPLVTDSNRWLIAGLLLITVALTLAVSFWASQRGRSATDYYVGGRSFSALGNGLAMTGLSVSAASYLGVTGVIALYGYDGFLYSVGFLVAW